MRRVNVRGLELELDAPPGGDSGVCADDLPPSEVEKDGTGLGTVWAASELLCDYLEANPTIVSGASVLELGAGAGVPGLLAARLGAARVQTTDYHASVLDRLRHNAARNGLVPPVEVAALDWNESADVSEQHDLVIGADLAPSESVAQLLAATVRRQLTSDGEGGGGGGLAGGRVFVYAHQERRAIYRAADGSFAREESDGALAALEPNIFGNTNFRYTDKHTFSLWVGVGSGEA